MSNKTHRPGVITTPVSFGVREIRFAYEPGNGTRFEVWLSWIRGTKLTDGHRLIVSLLNFNTCMEVPPFPVDAGYVGEKLRLKGTDAEHMAKLINAQLE